jgi:hypothetical protein
MFSTHITQEGMAMTDARAQLVSQASISRMAATIGAGLLVFVGIVFQLCELGWGAQSANSFWLVRTIVGNVWDLLALRLDVPVIGEVLHFWPLILIAFGLAILMALKPQNREDRSNHPREGADPRV